MNNNINNNISNNLLLIDNNNTKVTPKKNGRQSKKSKILSINSENIGNLGENITVNESNDILDIDLNGKQTERGIILRGSTRKSN